MPSSTPAASDPPSTVRTHRVTLANTGDTFEVCEGDRILAAARRAGIWLPYECGWGGCGTCKVTVVEGEADLLFTEAPAVDARDARRRRMVTCQTTPTSDLVIKPLWASEQPRVELPTADHRAQLVDVEELAPEIRRFRFQLEREAVYRAGQYAILEVAPGLRRCYSMSDLSGSPVVEFIAKRYERRPGSEQLFALPVGCHIQVELPYGDMWLREGVRPVVLVAGGTGISPILALVRQLSAIGDQRPVRVFYGATTRAELVCWDELGSLVDGMSDGRLYGALLTPDDSWTGTTGFVTDSLTPYLEGLADSDIYLAGPPPMVNAVRALLREQSVQVDRVHYDSFG
ncbi:2Fe-2S iron-sulfur cluster binding domain-containing protein [Streptomyces sp. NPDC005202]|uniref:2Fe-2S iron-sulfur cluster binding domain-containing protein n=1 Tax=Streptomyces sp. NPDC005202 TaxID=3157021 RepID=UPI0033A3D909